MSTEGLQPSDEKPRSGEDPAYSFLDDASVFTSPSFTPAHDYHPIFVFEDEPAIDPRDPEETFDALFGTSTAPEEPPASDAEIAHMKVAKSPTPPIYPPLPPNAA